MCILEIAKLHIYKFHYDIMKANFKHLMYLINSENIYSDFKNKTVYDKGTETYEDINRYVNNENSMKLGLFKDECGGKVVLSFIELKSKLYSLLF